MNAELNEGATDGAHKKVIRDRGGIGVTDTLTVRTRADLSDVWYGIHEQPVKLRPDGKPVHTPNFVPTATSQIGF